MGFKLAEAYVELGVRSHLGAGFAAARQQTVAAVAGLNAAASRAALGVAAIGSTATLAGLGALAYGLYKGVQGAADLGESISKVEQVFEDSAGKITGLADEMAKAYGTPKKEILDAASAFGLVGQAAGQSTVESAKLATEMAKLAVDATSFFDVPLDVALEKLRSGLVGEAEPLRAFGVLLSENAVKAEAARLGLGGMGKELSESAKVAARASLIRNAPSMRKASGDLERTKDSPKNRQREIAGRTENALVSVGQAVMPIWKEIVGQVNRVGIAIGAFVDTYKPTIESWAQSAVASVRSFALGLYDLATSAAQLGSSQTLQGWGRSVGGVFEWLRATVANTVGDLLERVGLWFRNFDDIVALTAVDVKESVGNMGAAFDWLMGAAGQYLGWLGTNWPQVFRDAMTASFAILQNFASNVQGLFAALWEYMQNPAGGFNFESKGLLDGFKATVEKLPEIAAPVWVTMAKERDEILGRIGANEAKHQADMARQALAMAAGNVPAAAAAAKPAGPPGAADGAGKGKPGKDPQASFFGLEEFAKHLQTAAFGGAGKTGAIEKVGGAGGGPGGDGSVLAEIAKNTKQVADWFVANGPTLTKDRPGLTV